MCGVLDSFTKI